MQPVTAQTFEECRRFGDLLVSLGMAGRAQVDEALTRQRGMPGDGGTRRLGVILVDQGILTSTQVVDVLGRQGKRLLCCAACAASYNAVGSSPSPCCPTCGGPLRAPESPADLRAALPALQTFLISGSAAVAETLAVGAGHARAPLAAEPSEPGVGDLVGRYRLEHRLGEGGMGVVWKAFDPELDRCVALKWIRSDSIQGEASLERFRREARLAAKLRHPAIVTVHSVGEERGRCTLAMECVEGRTFTARLDETRDLLRSGAPHDPARLRKDVEILAEVAAAAAFAHQQGVIHRDLKPANILLDAAENPHVMDFGLAKELHAARQDQVLTIAGQALGTPSYMSPEQAMGDAARIGAATDVWALGIILYEILTGETPFERFGSVHDVMQAVVDAVPDPPRARNKHIAAALEAVCLRALASDPASRYESAQAFEQDLRSWLRGEPVTARPAGRSERAIRWARRRRTGLAWATAAAALLAFLCVWGWSARAGRLEQARTALAQVGEAVRDFEDAVLRTRLSAEEKAELAAQPLQLVERLVAADPECGPAYTRRAQVKILLGRAREAEEDFDLACRRAPDQALVWLGRGMYTLEKYREARPLPGSTLSSAGVEFVAPAPETVEQTEWKRRGLEDLRRGIAAAPEDRGFGDEELRIGKALAALYSGQGAGCEEAIVQLQGVARTRAGKLRAQALYLLHRFGESVSEFDRTLQTWPEDVETWLGRGLALLASGLEKEIGGGDSRAEVRRAVADFEQILRRLPNLTEGFNSRGAALVQLAQAQSAHGEDPQESLRRAIVDFDEMIRRAPDYAGAYGNVALAHQELGRCEALHGRDARDSYRKALEKFDEWIRRAPDSAPAYVGRGNARVMLGDFEEASGEDARARYRLAIVDYDQALQLAPDVARSYDGRAFAYAQIGRANARHGEEFTASFERAIADHDAAVRLSPQSADSYVNRGFTRIDFARLLEDQGIDPCPGYRDAIADFDEAQRRNPRHVAALCNRGLAETYLGVAENGRGRDGSETLRRAIRDCDAVLALDAQLPVAYNNRGLARTHLARRSAAAGQDPREELLRASADLDEALRLNPELSIAWRNRANAGVDLGLADATRGIDPRERYRKALDDFGEAIRRNPSEAHIHLDRGRAYALQGEAEAALGLDPSASYRKALAADDEAVRLVPGWFVAHARRADHGVALGERSSGAEARDLFRKAIEDYGQALRIRPDQWDELVNRSAALIDLGLVEAAMNLDPRESMRRAVDDCTEAIRRSPTCGQAYNNRANAWYRIGDAEAARKLASAESYRRAEADYHGALERNISTAIFNLALLFQTEGRYADAIAAFEDGAVRLPAQAAGARRRVAEILLQWTPWQEDFTAADRETEAGRYATARGAYERGLALLEKSIATFSPELRAQLIAQPKVGPAVVNAHYNLACIFALASAGRDGPAGVAHAIPADESSRLRHAAFEHLDATCKLGWKDAARFDEDPDLAPLRTDARWKAWRDAVGK